MHLLFFCCTSMPSKRSVDSCLGNSLVDKIRNYGTLSVIGDIVHLIHAMYLKYSYNIARKGGKSCDTDKLQGFETYIRAGKRWNSKTCVFWNGRTR